LRPFDPNEITFSAATKPFSMIKWTAEAKSNAQTLGGVRKIAATASNL
jgi:hypothetical protein